MMITVRISIKDDYLKFNPQFLARLGEKVKRREVILGEPSRRASVNGDVDGGQSILSKSTFEIEEEETELWIGQASLLNHNSKLS